MQSLIRSSSSPHVDVNSRSSHRATLMIAQSFRRLWCRSWTLQFTTKKISSAKVANWLLQRQRRHLLASEVQINKIAHSRAHQSCTVKSVVKRGSNLARHPVLVQRVFPNSRLIIAGAVILSGRKLISLSFEKKHLLHQSMLTTLCSQKYVQASVTSLVAFRWRPISRERQWESQI